MTARSYCRQPEACVAGQRGACRVCQVDSLAANRERLQRLHADPEFRAKLGREPLPLTPTQRRLYAKLRSAGIPRDTALAEAQREVP